MFTRFRYVHEWAGASISLQSSFKKEQMYLHSLSPSRPFRSPPIYDGFLDPFVKSIKKYNKELEINKWNVYLANVPFLEIKGQKARPVIVIAKIAISAKVGTKCPRCWLIVDEIKDDVCNRCYEVLSLNNNNS